MQKPSQTVTFSRLRRAMARQNIVLVIVMWLHDVYVISSVQYTMTLCMQVLYGVYHVAMVSDLLKYQELSLPCTMTQIDISLHFSVPIYSALPKILSRQKT